MGNAFSIFIVAGEKAEASEFPLLSYYYMHKQAEYMKFSQANEDRIVASCVR